MRSSFLIGFVEALFVGVKYGVKPRPGRPLTCIHLVQLQYVVHKLLGWLPFVLQR